jgi:hypothetical protein
LEIKLLFAVSVLPKNSLSHRGVAQIPYNEDCQLILTSCRLLLVCSLAFLSTVFLRALIGQDAETAMLVGSLRDVIRNQSQEIESLQQKLKQATSSAGDEVRSTSYFYI